jgi:hypothetical protein
VPRFRTGLTPKLDDQLEIIQQLMGPFKSQVIELFWENVQSSFPILDNDSCTALRNGNFEKLPQNTVCAVLATGALYWFHSEALKMHPRPDMHYICNKVRCVKLRTLVNL